MTDVEQVPLTFKRVSFTGFMHVMYSAYLLQIHMFATTINGPALLNIFKR